MYQKFVGPCKRFLFIYQITGRHNTEEAQFSLRAIHIAPLSYWENTNTERKSRVSLN
jgi:hypothetical protein